MPDYIHDNEFRAFEKGGWHRLGTVVFERETATEAFEKMTPYRLYEVKARIAIPGEIMNQYSVTGSDFNTDSGYKGIVRPPYGSDQQWRLFGVVKDTYRLVQPIEFVHTADKATGNRGIETIGVIQYGASMFICYPLPRVNIRGDEYEDWLVVSNDMSGGGALRIFLTRVRAVCYNTVEAGWISASRRRRITHDQHVLDDMEFWLQSMMGQVEAETAALTEVFEILATTSVNTQIVKNTLEVAYPHRVMPNLEGIRSTERVQKMEQNIITHNTRMDKFREGVQELFEGQAVGYESPFFKGTCYGLYNSLVEHEDWRKGRARESALVGSRAQTKARGYRAIAEGIGLISSN